MKTHTSQFKEDIKTIGKQLDSKITFKVDGVTQTLTSEDLNGVTPTFQGAILKSVMKELDIDSNVNISIGTEVNYQFGVKLENDFEYLDYGNYIVYSSEKQEDTSSYKIICYDKMLYSMKQNEDLGITYPISIRNYINALCTKIGLEFKNKNDEFANFDRVLDKELYVGLDYTYRDILDELAQVTASTICLDNEDKVEIRYINDLTELNEVVGTNININDSIDYKLNSLTLYGRSTQATRSGKNIITSLNTKQNNYINYNLDNSLIKKTMTFSCIIDTSITSANLYIIPATGVSAISLGTINFTANQRATKTFNLTDEQIQAIKSNQGGIFQIYKSSAFENVNITDAQLEEGSTATDYEPYGVMPSPDFPSPIESITEISVEVSGINSQSNSLTIDLQGNELCSLPNGTKDELVIENGEALLTKRIDKVILNGSENWTLYSNKTHTFSLRMGQTINKHDRAYCSHFTEINPDKFGVANGIYSAYTNAIIISYLDCDTVDEFKTWLSNHNVEVLYELEEPETINLGEVVMPHTYEGVSNITNSADTEMVVKYSKGWETINEEYLKDINVNFG